MRTNYDDLGRGRDRVLGHDNVYFSHTASCESGGEYIPAVAGMTVVTVVTVVAGMTVTVVAGAFNDSPPPPLPRPGRANNCWTNGGGGHIARTDKEQ